MAQCRTQLSGEGPATSHNSYSYIYIQKVFKVSYQLSRYSLHRQVSVSMFKAEFLSGATAWPVSAAVIY